MHAGPLEGKAAGMSWTTRALGALLAGAALIGLSWASHLPMTPYPSANAMLRLAWSARPERIEECRSASDDELAAVPPHMRQPVICEGRAARYRLEASIAGEPAIDLEVRGGGLRHDRRLFVFQELPVAPGETNLAVRFTRIDTPGPETAAAPRAEFVAPRLVLEQRMRLEPNEVVLVTYDDERRTLVAVRGRESAGR